MKIIREANLQTFEFWSGAKNNARLLTFEELGMIEIQLEELEQDFTETEINDMFWFDFEYILGMVGLTEEEAYNR